MQSQLNSAPGGARALAIFPGALGDFVCFLPALCAIARGRGVELCARTEYGDLLPAHIHARSIERRDIGQLFVTGADLRETEEFFRQFEFVYSWSGSGDAVLRENFARAAGSKGRLFTFRPAAARTHIIDYYLACVGAPPGAQPAVAIKPDALDWARAWLRANGLEGARLLAVAPGSGATEKNWPREYFREVIEWWERSPGGKGRSPSGKVSVVLGPAEEAEYAFWTEHAPVARGLSLGQLAALLSMADVYLGNDSGVTHLAAAVGAKTVALFGPTSPAEWAPRGRDVEIISLGVECSPCDGPAMKICPHRKCLTTLMPREVIAVLE
ncbi:MAG TPA: glycosyltransferase family 9 protein [Candidatus Binatia bacterium]|nr:glycosyltransferase family 9 protein [Candidatus Binatia bacterium]